MFKHGNPPVTQDPDGSTSGSCHAHQFCRGPRLGCQNQSISQARQQAFFIQQPDLSGFIRSDVMNFAVFPGCRNIHRLEPPVFIPGHLSIFMADPQRAVVGFKQTGHAAVAHLRRIAVIKNREPHAIEPRQATVSAEPQITVTGLHHRRNRVLGQAVFRLPGANKIVGRRGNRSRKNPATGQPGQRQNDSTRERHKRRPAEHGSNLIALAGSRKGNCFHNGRPKQLNSKTGNGHKNRLAYSSCPCPSH